MIFRINYVTRTPAIEIFIPWKDVWNGTYRDMLRPVYDYIAENNLEPAKITEYRDGLVWELKRNIPLPEMPLVLSHVPKTKIKVSEVFKAYEDFFTDGISTDEYNGSAESSKA